MVSVELTVVIVLSVVCFVLLVTCVIVIVLRRRYKLNWWVYRQTTIIFIKLFFAFFHLVVLLGVRSCALVLKLLTTYGHQPISLLRSRGRVSVWALRLSLLWNDPFFLKVSVKHIKVFNTSMVEHQELRVAVVWLDSEPARPWLPAALKTCS